MTKPLALLALCLLLAAPLWAEVTLYVALTGNDAWSGRLDARAADGSDGPFATPQRAVAELANLRRSAPSEAVTILLRAGTYRLSNTLTLTEQHSGTAEAPVTLASYPGERATLSGAIPITGWKRAEGGVYTATLGQDGTPWRATHQLFFRGERRELARFPNLDPQHPLTGGFLYVDRQGTPKKQAFHYAAGEFSCEQWGDLSQAEVNLFPYNCWDHNISPIAQVVPEQRYVRLKCSVAGWINEANRYFIENVREALDSPGEWYLDYRTGKVDFVPPGGAVADGEVEMPAVENLICLSGTAEEPI